MKFIHYGNRDDDAQLRILTWVSLTSVRLSPMRHQKHLRLLPRRDLFVRRKTQNSQSSLEHSNRVWSRDIWLSKRKTSRRRGRLWDERDKWPQSLSENSHISTKRRKDMPLVFECLRFKTFRLKIDDWKITKHFETQTASMEECPK